MEFLLALCRGPLPAPGPFGEGLATSPCWREIGSSIVRHAHSQALQLSYVYLRLFHRTALSRHCLIELAKETGKAWTRTERVQRPPA